MSQAKWVLTDDIISFSECTITEVRLSLGQGAVLLEEHKSLTRNSLTLKIKQNFLSGETLRLPSDRVVTKGTLVSFRIN